MGENTGSLISRSPEFSREEKCVNRKLTIHRGKCDNRGTKREGMIKGKMGWEVLLELRELA